MYDFEILDPANYHQVVPLLFELNGGRVSHNVLEERLTEMAEQNYECAVIRDGDRVIGVTGLWYCTRHYIGRSVELDHVYILEEYRGSGLGKIFMKWIESRIRSKGAESLELNTYVQNYPSHKFYYNQGLEILGYHFLKKL